MTFDEAKEITDLKIAQKACDAAAGAINEVMQGLYDENSFNVVIVTANEHIYKYNKDEQIPNHLTFKTVAYYLYWEAWFRFTAASLVYARTD